LDLVGVGRLRTRGHGSDNGAGESVATGYGSGAGRLRIRLSSSGPICGCGGGGETSDLLSPVLIRRVVTNNLGQVRYCYQQALEHDAGPSGHVTVRWVIGSDGGVMSVRTVVNDTGVASFGDCVANAVRRWQFPAPNRGVVTVSYPFAFDVVE
jgi:TonB family protein